MGSSGGGSFSGKSSAEISRMVRQEEEKSQDAQFETTVSEKLGDLLSTYNDRDTKLVKERIDDVLKQIGKETESRVEILFGGSISKHTYVNGLSDIDCLLLMDREELAGKPPKAIIEYVANLLSEKLEKKAMVEPGMLAITVKYGDGIEIQFLPSFRAGDRFQIASPDGRSWSQINPEAFAKVLTDRNQKCNGKLIPTIKLAKAINDQLPESNRLSGYHVESLAAEAFKDYSGSTEPKEMLKHFFSRAAELVKEPIRDRTGQSVHVDEYLGESNSPARQRIGHLLNRISKRMKNASAGRSIEQWLGLFGE